MADNNKQDSGNNLIDLASERRRHQQKSQAPAHKKKPSPGTKASNKLPAAGKPRWFHYLQLVLFLCAMAYFMTLCQGSH